jgi:hypothetical protein
MAHDTAFALAGLGGFNAHGAGFLQAARDNGYEPDLVTATSGQIVVLARYLEKAPDLRQGLIDPDREANPFAQLETALFGYPDVFRPAYREQLARLFSPFSFSDKLTDVLAQRLLPAQQYAPARTREIIDGLVKTFNDSPIGVVFNAYDPTAGEGVLFGNDVARKLMRTKSSIPIAPTGDVKYRADSGKETAILPIDAGAIEAALWLSLYGFENLPGGLMDGAYHRSCILSELHNFSRVIVARPLASGWQQEKKPKSWFDVQDWQCEMWFSVGYKAEVDAMKRINRLIERGIIDDPDFKYVDLREIEPPTPAGYFNYFIERAAVFDAAYALADAEFKALATLDAPSQAA